MRRATVLPARSASFETPASTVESRFVRTISSRCRNLTLNWHRLAIPPLGPFRSLTLNVTASILESNLDSANNSLLRAKVLVLCVRQLSRSTMVSFTFFAPSRCSSGSDRMTGPCGEASRVPANVYPCRPLELCRDPGNRKRNRKS